MQVPALCGRVRSFAEGLSGKNGTAPISGAEKSAEGGAFLLEKSGKSRQENNFLREGVRGVDTRSFSGYNLSV